MTWLLRRYGRWINEMDMLPKGYGVAWFAIYSAQAFCLPVPFNRIVGSFRAWYLDWRRPCEDDPVLLAHQQGRELGWRDGERYGYEKGLRHSAIVAQELDRFLNENAIRPSHRTH